MYELVVVWETGETDIFEYETEEKALSAGRGMFTALGKQIAWYGVRKKVCR